MRFRELTADELIAGFLDSSDTASNPAFFGHPQAMNARKRTDQYVAEIRYRLSKLEVYETERALEGDPPRYSKVI